MKAIGLNDAVNSCDCCGKAGLKHTVIILLDDGNVVHYGSVCATRNTQKAAKVLKKEIKEHHENKKRNASIEYRSHPDFSHLERMSQSKAAKGLIGSEYQAFCEPYFSRVTALGAEIAKKYGIAVYEVR